MPHPKNVANLFKKVFIFTQNEYSKDYSSQVTTNKEELQQLVYIVYWTWVQGLQKARVFREALKSGNYSLKCFGLSNVLPNSQRCLWRWFTVCTFNSRATALVDIPAVSMPIARSRKTCDICCAAC